MRVRGYRVHQVQLGEGSCQEGELRERGGRDKAAAGGVLAVTTAKDGLQPLKGKLPRDFLKADKGGERKGAAARAPQMDAQLEGGNGGGVGEEKGERKGEDGRGRMG